MPETIKVFCRLRPLPSTQAHASNSASSKALLNRTRSAPLHSSTAIQHAVDESSTSADGQHLLLTTPAIVYAQISAADAPAFDSPGSIRKQQQNSASKARCHQQLLLSAGFGDQPLQQYRFKFNHIMRADATQTQVFERVGLPVVKSCLDGFNGCVFAYGQTGSGKTYTMTGGGENYDDRGIIPRTLQYMYREIAQRRLSSPPAVSSTTEAIDFSDGGGDIITVAVSYIEIYNDNGYDLLNPNFRATKLEDLPRIQLFEDQQQQQVRMKNVSLHPISSEKEALDFLFLGDMNRAIAETPMNQASTRSHCLFTLYISVRSAASAAVRQSKLHLVDLAGSERVYKSQVDGRILNEAKYINLSLHHLEQVIIALSENPSGHIPYRNSTMTSILRDSIGGNCMTTMIATVSLESTNFGETISTCRFAQRVALVKNSAVVNEVVDPQLVIEQLRKEVELLKQQLSLAGGFAADDCAELSADELQNLHERVKKFLLSARPGSGSKSGDQCHCAAGIAHAAQILNLSPSWKQIYCCFCYAREEYKISKLKKKPESLPSLSEQDLRKLGDIVRQRDSEIGVLVKLLRKEKERADEVIKASITEAKQQTESDARPGSAATSLSSCAGGMPKNCNASTSSLSTVSRYNNNALDVIRKSIRQYGADFSAGKEQAWLIFQREHPDAERANNIADLLRRKTAEAKTLAQKLSECRADIENVNNSNCADSDSTLLRDELERKQCRIRTLFDCLKRCKEEIDHLNRQQQQIRLRIQCEFETFWQNQVAQFTKQPQVSLRKLSEQQKPGQKQDQTEQFLSSVSLASTPSDEDSSDSSDTSSSDTDGD